MKYLTTLTIIIYLGLAALHIYIVHNTVFLLILVSLFEAARLTAVSYKVKFPVGILGIFSVVFISNNYFTMYADNLKKIADNAKTISLIDNYSNKYWTSQDVFMRMLDTKQAAMTATINLPDPIIVSVLVALIELSLAYMVIMQKNHTIPNPTKKKEPSPQDKNGNDTLEPTSLETIPTFSVANTVGIIPKSFHEENKEKSHETKNSQNFSHFSQNSHAEILMGKSGNFNETFGNNTNGNFPKTTIAKENLKIDKQDTADLFPEIPIIPTSIKLHVSGNGKFRKYYKGDEQITRSTYYRYLNNEALIA
jgi:hypothetical protein